jgi:hypothetical protein
MTANNQLGQRDQFSHSIRPNPFHLIKPIAGYGSAQVAKPLI